jgi:hyaluronan synthase
MIKAVGLALSLLTTLGLLIKFLLGHLYRPTKLKSAHPTSVAVLIPFYNEDPELLRLCLLSVLAQTRRPDEVVIVDDGSLDLGGSHIADGFCEPGRVQLLRHIENRGKRESLGTALAATTALLIVTVDSDTVLDPDALENAIHCFNDPTIMAVAADVRAFNARRNLLTRMQDIQYAQSFCFQRASQSVLSTVMCCCGSLAFYRRRILDDNLSTFLNQKFLGAHVQYGDDRRLTNYALREGRVIFQATSRASTAVPENLRHFFRQQVRWTRSFIRESLWAMTRLSWKTVRPWLALGDLALWGPLYACYFVWLGYRGFTANTFLLALLLSFLCVSSVVRSWRAASRRNLRFWRIPCLWLSPIVGLLHMILAPFVLVFACLTLRSEAWGTRRVIEVFANGDPALTVLAPPGDRTPTVEVITAH